MTTAYEDALRRILDLPPLELEAAGALRVVRCVLMPSFHREGALTWIERDDASEVIVRIVQRPVAVHLAAVRGSEVGDPITAWIEPGVSTERLTIASRPMRAAIDEAVAVTTTRSALGLDGMSVAVELGEPRRSAPVESFRLWSGTDQHDPRHRMIVAMLDTALEHARWDASRDGLRDLRGYLAP